MRSYSILVGFGGLSAADLARAVANHLQELRLQYKRPKLRDHYIFRGYDCGNAADGHQIISILKFLRDLSLSPTNGAHVPLGSILPVRYLPPGFCSGIERIPDRIIKEMCHCPKI